MFQEVPYYRLAAILLGALALYTVYGLVYRLYLSPVAKVPGPRLAAITFFYEIYYDWIKDGRYSWKIAELHEKYGPIVRINPEEIHINDPDFYDEIYHGPSQGKTDKWERSVRIFESPNQTVATVGHDLHRARRSSYAFFFSKQSVRAMESSINACIDKLCSRFEQSRRKGEPVNIKLAYSALTSDIITAFCFGESYNLLDNPSYAEPLCDLIDHSISENIVIFQYFPWVFLLLNALPKAMVKAISPGFALLIQYQGKWKAQVREVRERNVDLSEKGELVEKDASKTTVIEAIYNSKLPASERSDSRMMYEAQTMVIAGTATTAAALMVSTYFILSSPSILSNLLSELASVSSNPSDVPSLAQLELLPYLNAIVYEGLRMSYGVSHRLQRVSPDRTITYGKYALPPGTPIGMTSIHIHDNPTIFEDPRAFRPERWLPLETTGLHLQKYLVPFSKGSRSCLGMNLANAELRLGLAQVFLRFGKSMRVVDTVRERDIDISRDGFNPLTAKESKGVFIMLDGKE